MSHDPVPERDLTAAGALGTVVAAVAYHTFALTRWHRRISATGDAAIEDPTERS